MRGQDAIRAGLSIGDSVRENRGHPHRSRWEECCFIKWLYGALRCFAAAHARTDK